MSTAGRKCYGSSEAATRTCEVYLEASVEWNFKVRVFWTYSHEKLVSLRSLGNRTCYRSYHQIRRRRRKAAAAKECRWVDYLQKKHTHSLRQDGLILSTDHMGHS